MKVNIYETVEISDEQRVQLAVVLDDGQVKPKRQATRDEIKEFIWTHGKDWGMTLGDQYNEALADSGNEPEPEDADDAEDEDLLGDDEDLLG